jgi:putative flavoprotein involved in K+ transport
LGQDTRALQGLSSCDAAGSEGIVPAKELESLLWTSGLSLAWRPMVVRTDTVIIGAGQAGLSLSARLTARGHRHVVLERGQIGERWRSERWDSLHMLTPNWLNRLHGAPAHADPHGFLGRDGFVSYLQEYASSFGMPVQQYVDVRSVERRRGGFRVATDSGEWVARRVVVATGDCVVPHRPTVGGTVSPEITQLDAARYRSPGQLPPGSVLVVGAGPSGLQIATELRRAGRAVVLAVGSHARAVRRYRGRDIWHWIARLGDLEDSVEDVPKELRRTPSFALSGQNGGEELDLGTVSKHGVTLAGRLTGISGSSATFDDNLVEAAGSADHRLFELLARIDAHIDRSSDAAEIAAAEPVARVGVGSGPRSLDLGEAGVSTIVWATGYHREYPWLHVPVLDHAGEIVQRHGVTPVTGLFVLGLRFQSRRTSHTIGGVSRDAAAIAQDITCPPQACREPVRRRAPARLTAHPAV